MDSQFWISAWKEGRTNFHREFFDEKLVEYFPQLNAEKGQKILVPLCGKSKDLLWLQSLGLLVHGIELYKQAVESFFDENEIPVLQKTQDEVFTHYISEGITISCGDFLKLNDSDAYDFVYDRAALVALPAPMREAYAQVIRRSLRKGGKYLLLTYEYNISELDGPPFSIETDEIHRLYGDQFTIKLLESQKPANEGSKLANVKSLRKNIYILQK